MMNLVPQRLKFCVWCLDSYAYVYFEIAADEYIKYCHCRWYQEMVATYLVCTLVHQS